MHTKRYISNAAETYYLQSVTIFLRFLRYIKNQFTSYLDHARDAKFVKFFVSAFINSVLQHREKQLHFGASQIRIRYYLYIPGPQHWFPLLLKGLSIFFFIIIDRSRCQINN